MSGSDSIPDVDDDYIDYSGSVPSPNFSAIAQAIVGSVLFWIITPVITAIELFFGGLTAIQSGIQRFLTVENLILEVDGEVRAVDGLVSLIFDIPGSVMEGLSDGISSTLEPAGILAFPLSVILIAAIAWILVRGLLFGASILSGVI